MDLRKTVINQQFRKREEDNWIRINQLMADCESVLATHISKTINRETERMGGTGNQDEAEPEDLRTDAVLARRIRVLNSKMKHPLRIEEIKGGTQEREEKRTPAAAIMQIYNCLGCNKIYFTEAMLRMHIRETHIKGVTRGEVAKAPAIKAKLKRKGQETLSQEEPALKIGPSRELSSMLGNVNEGIRKQGQMYIEGEMLPPMGTCRYQPMETLKEEDTNETSINALSKEGIKNQNSTIWALLKGGQEWK